MSCLVPPGGRIKGGAAKILRGLTAVERTFYDLRFARLATAIDHQPLARFSQRRRDVAEPDVLADGRPHGAGGHLAHLFAGRLGAAGVDGVAVAGDAPPEHDEADQLARDAAGLLFGEGALADEVAGIELDHPAQTRLER